jgi:hypothetical protein
MKHLSLASPIAVLCVLLSNGAASQGFVTVNGVVDDEAGLAVPGVALTLIDVASGVSREAVTDGSGRFVFEQVASGRYALNAEVSGFQRVEMAVTVGTDAPPPVRIRLKIALEEEVTVTGTLSTDPLAAERNAAATELDPEALRGLPTDGQDVLSLVGNFLSPALGRTSIVVDGAEGDGLDPPPSAIHRVFINRNPYSAEFKRPGRARIEIVTERGSRRYFRGTSALFVRNSALDARHPFATTRPDLDRRVFEATLGGPLPGKGLSFFGSAQRFVNRDEAVVNARTLAGPLVENLLTSERRANALARLDWRRGAHAFTARYDALNDLEPNHGVGGLRLADQGFRTLERRQGLQLASHEVFSAALVNDLRVDLNQSRRQDGDAARGPAVVVAGAFIGGSSQIFRTAHNASAQIQEIATLGLGSHVLRVGGRVRPAWIDAFDASNFGGTFEFSDLSAFARAVPVLFRVERGSHDVSFSRYETSAFVEDAIRIGSHVGVTIGLRHDFESRGPTSNAFAPRLSVAFAPGGGRTVVRGGAGMFVERLSDSAIERASLVDGTRLREIVIANPPYPDPFGGQTPISTLPASIVRIDPALETPSLVQAGVGVERALWRKTFLTIEYEHLKGDGLFRSRNVNAPQPGSDRRPEPALLNVNQIESTGTRQGDALTATFRGRIQEFRGTMQYVLSKTTDDTSGPFSLPADNYNLAAERGRADFDRRQRFTLAGAYEWPQSAWRLGAVLTLASGAPFDITTGSDDNHDLSANDRPPGVTRNTGRGPGLAQIDLRISKLFALPRAVSRDDPELRKRSEAQNFELTADFFNVLNRTNPSTIVGVASSPLFGRAVAARQPRTIQLSARYRF